ncbi:hypothetical protein D0T87_06020 [Bacteroides sp. 51]|nr:hypothetical protein [Bacteroides sp. 51]
MFLTMGIALYTSRIVLNQLGFEDYGIYNVIAGVVGMLVFMNGALSASTSRFITYELGKKNQKGLVEVFRSALTIHLLLALLLVLLAETIGLWFVNNKLVIPADRISVANILYQFVILSSVISILQVPLTALIIAYERMSIYAYIAIADTLLKLLIAYLLAIYAGDKLLLYGMMISIVTALSFTFYLLYVRKQYRDCTFYPIFRKERLREMFSYSAWSLWGSLAYMLKDQGVNVLLNIFFGPVVNTARGIAYQVNVAVNSFTQNFTIALNPQIIKSYASEEFHRMHSLIFGGTKLSFYLLLLIATPVVLKADYILSLWLVNVPEYTVIFTRLVMVNSLLESYTYVIGASIQATGKIKWYQIIVGGLLLLNLPLSYVLLKQGFPPYITLVVAIGLTLFSIILRIFFLKSMLNISFRSFLFRVVGITFLVASLSLILIWITLKFMPIGGFMGLLLTVLVSTLYIFIIIWCIGLNHNEKNMIYNLVPNKRKMISCFKKVAVVIFVIFACIFIFLFFYVKSTIPPKTISENKIVHVSIDDVSACLYDLKLNVSKYKSAFDQPFFAELKRMHEEHGAVFTLYIYEQTPDFKITELPIKYRDFFIENSSWLKFGYHSISPEFNDSIVRADFLKSFEKVNNAIVTFAGRESCASTLRLHYYYASDDMISSLKNKGINRLLGADNKGRISYNLSENESEKLFNDHFLQKDSVLYFKTDLRLEQMDYFPLELWQYQDRDTLVFFTHEWALNKINKLKFQESVKWFSENNYEFSFLE